MKTDRLLRLADKLSETGPYEGVKLTEKMKFSLDNWCHCGTVACAVGHAAFDPWFRQRGLTLIDDGTPLKEPAYKGVTGDYFDRSRPVAAFFDISSDDVELLFFPSSYGRSRNAKTVAKRIREFVAAE